MTNTLVGDVYLKIIEEVIATSTTDFEENGVSQITLQELQQEWQAKLSERKVAQMPWDPKPQPQPTPQPSAAASASNGLPSSTYANYDSQPSPASTNGARIKTEPGSEPQYNGVANGYQAGGAQPQGGAARATQLLQQQYGVNANASINAMQRAGAGSGLALPGQQQAKPQGLHLPGQTTSPTQPQYSPQQHQAMLQRQGNQPQVKVENDSPQPVQGNFYQQPVAQPNYTQTDGADDAYDEWDRMLAQRRAIAAAQGQEADQLIRDTVMQQQADLQNGLLLPLDSQPSGKRSKQKRTSKRAPNPLTSSPASQKAIPQLDGDYDEEEKPDIKDEDDENAINSDLDDSDEDDKGALGDDDDEFADQILCTYDKVQRVKNKWKCTLKDGVMSVGGKEWVFHKGMGEYEW